MLWAPLADGTGLSVWSFHPALLSIMESLSWHVPGTSTTTKGSMSKGSSSGPGRMAEVRRPLSLIDKTDIASLLCTTFVCNIDEGNPAGSWNRSLGNEIPRTANAAKRCPSVSQSSFGVGISTHLSRTPVCCPAHGCTPSPASWSDGLARDGWRGREGASSCCAI
jgi:hypothetical protein